MLHQHTPDYQPLSHYGHFSILRCCTVSVLRNHLHAHSHLWQKLLSQISHSFWSIVLAYEVTGSLLPWLLLVGAYEWWYVQLATIRDKRKTLARNHGVCWPHTGKLWNYKKSSKFFILFISVLWYRYFTQNTEKCTLILLHHFINTVLLQHVSALKEPSSGTITDACPK